MGLKNTTVDDRDMTVIKYQGTWFNTGTYNATSVGKTGTLSTSNDLNAGFTIDTREQALLLHYLRKLTF
jgi:hypothetical protein